ncbi:MAG: serine/threonine-protein phosphatase [Lachnospiraceae bacterium]|nr:serine/threonine-protein phosphatase [Lachnospiraceae bacterium]
MLKRDEKSKRILTAAISDQGAFRTKNQDRVLCRTAMIGGYEVALACVCDGIGSFPNSEISSEMMVQGIELWFQDMASQYATDFTKKGFLNDLEHTIQTLNEQIFLYREQQHEEIGCTLSLILSIDGQYHVMHAGDSRIFCFRDHLEQLTRDEVVVRNVDGRIRSLLANYVGKNRELWMNRLSDEIREGDLWIVGTDGLHKHIQEEDLNLLKKASTEQKLSLACEKLVQKLRERGERDNISCAVLFYPKKHHKFLLKGK